MLHLQRILSVAALTGALGLTHSAVRADDVTVFAAASLRDAVGEVTQVYEAETGGSLRPVFAASSAVARQVAQGAPADVVLLADAEWASWLAANAEVRAGRVFAGNALVLITSQNGVLDDINTLPDAIGDGVLAMAEVTSVPAGRYGQAALQALGLWDALAPRAVQAANVRAALRFVERGEAAYGIGYASDLVALPKLTVAYAFDAGTHPAITYHALTLTPAGTAFVDVLMSENGQSALRTWGFTPPPDMP
ncbi:molybdate ABC transporter substrate-binding protein [Pseudooctadecabacter jejudonensis]|uniref:Molybdate-binding periplasmic protein n=1 Tax=Pseudooctadecabacter jejudonensis TaxID=1391910 RepID=A0A1Y5SV69_9RHOB|nr:molybdate ABC transporter substrate-binding protein [Pseudooctadecabacter jejudonensis]SLN49060.1 Molybdate-binding periplasmic protein precursor [Pseudooctadecabacter jejudonensis]